MNTGQLIQPVDESYILSRAYLPEHIPCLMTAISKAQAFMIEDCLGFAKENWVIFVGYPLDSQFDGQRCDRQVASVLETYRPEFLWFIGPEIPPQLARSCRSHQSDRYIVLDLTETIIKPSLRREVYQAAQNLTVAYTKSFTRDHQSLVDELMRRQNLPPMIAELYQSMPGYLSHTESAIVVEARQMDGKLSAFFVLEIAAERFDTYLLGCHSKVNYVPHASDLLFAEMIAYAQERGKTKINLGLGVNEGIRKFKMKWGGQPVLNYEFCECYYGPPGQLSILDDLLGELF